jgi:hypothetical protein
LRALTANGNLRQPKELCFTEGNEENQELSASLTSLSSVKNTIRFRQASPVCAGKNHPMNTVSHLQFMEVQQQAYRQVQLHVAQQLGLVDGVDFFDGFHYATVFT